MRHNSGANQTEQKEGRKFEKFFFVKQLRPLIVLDGVSCCEKPFFVLVTKEADSMFGNVFLKYIYLFIYF